MAEIESALKVWRAQKMSITRAQTFAENASSDISAIELATRIARLNDVWQKFEEYSMNLYSFADEKGFVDPGDDLAAYEEKYISTRVILETIRDLQIAPQQPNTIKFDMSPHVIQSNSPCDLPKVKIEPFSGDYGKWSAFKDLFISAIHSRADLTNTQKFYYLNSLLKDEAANLVRHIQVSETSYQSAWDRIKERYDRPRQIVNSYIETFMSIKPVKEEDSNGLRKISDLANEVVRGLEAIDQNERDPWLIVLLNNKLDSETRRKWVEDSWEDPKPTILTFLKFLDRRCGELELGRKPVRQPVSRPHTSTAMISVNNSRICVKCDSTEHVIYKCPQFTQLSNIQRRSFVKDKRLCFNCLSKGHSANNCKSQHSCKTCGHKHHSLVHLPSSQSPAPGVTVTSNSTNSPSYSSPSASYRTTSHPVSLNTIAESYPSNGKNFSRIRNVSHILPTAIVNVKNHQGDLVTCRVLLDTASELSYITENCVKRLGLQRQHSRIALSGISSVKADTTNGNCHIHIQSKVTQRSIDACVHVLGKITSSLPRFQLNLNSFGKFENVPLADPTFNMPSDIDILLGAGYVWEIFTMDKIRDDHGCVIAVSSIFGWVVTSALSPELQTYTSSMLTLVDIDQSLRAFWEIEDSTFEAKADESAVLAEEHFKNTHQRHTDGRYIVELPFIEENVTFENTYNGALTRFHSTERRLLRDPILKQRYTEFMKEYETLGHMRVLSQTEIDSHNDKLFYLPHHPIIGTKIRVVFDGSFGDVKGKSLNSQLHIGAPIQRNLFAVCLRFRFNKHIFSADIVKMFRQIWVADNHRNYQRILWRDHVNEPIKHFQLCTVTYGTASAPFLAIRVLQQLAEDYRESHPSAYRILQEDFYVDDVITGASSEAELIENRNELQHLLSLGGLELSKWVSNSSAITTSHHNNHHEPNILTQDGNNSSRVLGIHWYSVDDIIGYKVNLDNAENATKRKILSDVSRIFDPLGLVSPVIVKFKILFQQLWLLNVGWDDPLPQDLADTWLKYRNDLRNIEHLQINRFVFNSGEIHLHGFSDASTKAYSAVVYCRSRDDEGNIRVTIVASKTRVAPLKQISLPRLELCGALLLTRLMKNIIDSLTHSDVKLHAWCDSTVVLSWLSLPPIKLKTFVGNRTSEILHTLPRNIWRHVGSKENPADCASRGIMAEQLSELELWWKGPRWLQDQLVTFEQTSTTSLEPEHDEQFQTEIKANSITLTTNAASAEHPLDSLIEKTSSWTKLIRVTAYVLRFITLIKTKKRPSSTYLTFDELNLARTTCLTIAQNFFATERTCLQQNDLLCRNSSLSKLSPFIDDIGLLRVGGRITNSNLAIGVQHPIILPRDGKITKLILLSEHVSNLHPGVSSLFVIVRQKYWILGARNLIRKITHQCLKCFRYSRQITQQKMADLPAIRVQQAYPFQNTGCDYAGPFTLKLYKGRNAKTSKGYICLFVCMVTSAIHLELVTDLTTDCFLAALRTFMARRGKCATIFSDNGKNFVGAKRKLDEMYQHILAEDHNATVMHSLAKEGIKWTFIPPYSPHWGGIWESGVRSVKLHLKRVIGNTILTFEQMRTLLAQIEAVVNSRPLGFAADTEAYYLSPSHFLIGRPTTMTPEGNLTNLNINRLDYWQHLQSMYQGFWKRWSQEYLTSLQQRPKWKTIQPNFNIDDLVLVKEDNVPPAVWVTGKITETFPGKDGLVRVVKLHTANGEMTRSISKLIKLPIC